MEATDWDLHAVVRGCSSSSSSSFSCGRLDLPQRTCVTPPPGPQILMDEESLLLDWERPFEPTRSSAFDELHELCKPFYRKPQPVFWQNAPLLSSSSSSSLASSLFERTKSEPLIFGHVQRPSVGSRPGSQASKSKKRKNTLKKVSQVPAERISSDEWAWRKYGQKPIKGSPFPRSYYRCSSSKGCLARKQVERNRSDPGMFIVSYTGEHNHPAPTHRNSLAGVARQKQQNVKGTSPIEEEEEEEEEWEGLSGDDFFEGLEGLMGGGDKVEEGGRWDPCQTSFGFPWKTAAAAAGGI